MKLKTKKNRAKSYISVAIFLLIFISIGTMIIRSRAATPNSIVAQIPHQQILIEYSKEKPVVIHTTNAKTTYDSRPRTIDITLNNVLYCTPEDNGLVTTRQLTNDEQNQLSAQITKSHSEKFQNDVGAPNVPLVNKYDELTVKDAGVSKSNRFHNKKFETGYYSQTVDLLESFCKQDGKAIPDQNTPVVADLSSSKNSPSLAQKTRNLVVPQAYAAGNTGPQRDYDAADYQQISLNVYRQQNGKPALTRDSCLNDWAADWALHLATDGYLHHSNLITQYQNHCPTAPNGYHGITIAFGENIGMLPGINTSISQTYSKQLSDILFNGFVNSPEHRNNMLGVTQPYQFDGIGAYRSADKTKLFIVQAFRYNSGYVPPAAK